MIRNNTGIVYTKNPQSQKVMAKPNDNWVEHVKPTVIQVFPRQRRSPAPNSTELSAYLLILTLC